MQTSTHDTIEHYPVDLIDVWRAADGVRYLLRPVLPRDEVPLGDMVARVSRTSRYRRFHGSIRELPQASLRHMTRVDYLRHMALVVTATGAGASKVVADARYCVNDTGDAAEFAVLVDDAWQRRGLGLRIIRALGDAATRAGIRWLRGSVLVDNEPMLALMDRCGFNIRPDRDEADLVQVEIDLTAGFTVPTAISAGWNAPETEFIFVATLRVLINRWRLRRRRLRDERDLRELPERAMTDLGIGRSEIHAALRDGRSVELGHCRGTRDGTGAAGTGTRPLATSPRH